MKKILYTGCSFTEGNGFDLTTQEPVLWVNQLHKRLFADSQCLNLGRGGRSNQGIFQDTLHAITSTSIDTALVAWTSMPRYEMDLGCELYDTRHVVTPTNKARQHNLNNITYTANYLDKIRDRFITLANLHREICNLVDYCNILHSVGEKFNTRIFFINAICPWDENYFDLIQFGKPNDLTKFTQELLHVNNRDDSEIYDLYQKIHSDYQILGGIQASSWLNLYSSMQNLKIDTNNDGRHPGPKSNTIYADLFFQSLIKAL